MSYWSNLSKTNLLSLSQEQTDFQIALKEWKHTAGAVVDHLASNESCQLCEQSNLRYHFEIANQTTRNSLQIGSSCIEKFNIAVYDDEGNKLQGKDVLKQLNKEINVKQQEMMLEPLRGLWKRSDDDVQYIIERCVEKFDLYKGFAPKDLLYLFKQMDGDEIPYPPNIYKVLLRSNVDKKFLFGISETDKNLIWASLSTSQKQRYAKGKENYDKEKKEVRKRQRMEETRHYDDFRSEIKRHHQNQIINNDQNPLLDSSYSPQHAPYQDDFGTTYKYRVFLIDRQDKIIRRFIRGILEQSLPDIRQQAKRNPRCVRFEIKLISTDELVHQEFVYRG